jgi:hypothetical protein
MRTSFEKEGEVRGTDVLAALVALWREGASGSLQFSRSGATTGFEIGEGEVIGTQSSDPRFETAAILLRAGKLEEATLGRLAVPEGSDRALVALQAGILTRREWRWGEKIRAVELLADLLTWLEGEYWLLRTPGRTPGEFRLPIPRLILELFLRSRDRSLVLHHLGGVDHPLSRAESFDLEFPTFGLTADAESVVRLIDGRSTAAEIASEAPAEAFAVEKLLAALVTLGLVRPEFAGEAAVPPGSTLATAVEDAEIAHEETAEEEEEEVERGEAEGASESAGASAEEEAEGGAGEEAAAEETEIEIGPEEPPAEGAGEIEEVVLDEPEPTGRALGAGGSRAAPGEAGQKQETRLEQAVEDASLDGAIREDSLERARVRFEPESEMAGAPSEDLEPARETSDLAIPPMAALGTDGDGELPRRSKSTASLLVLLAVLAAGVAAVLLLRKSEAPRPEVSAAVTPASSPAPEAPPTAVAASVATAPSPAAVAPPSVGATGSGPVPSSTSRPAPTAGPTAGARRSRGEASRSSWLDRAARDQRRAAADRQARFAVQLELACEVPTLVDAWRHDRPPGSMWLLATSFRGRTCFRVLWGRYPSREAASQALASVPSFFSTSRNHPMVVAIR